MHKALAAALGALCVLATACGGGDDGPTSTEPAVIVGGPRSPSVTRVVGPTANATEPASPTPVHSPVLVSLDWIAADVTLPELPAFAGEQPDAGLQAAVEAALAGREGSYSVVVNNLADGRSAAVNEGKVYYAASLFKAALLLEAYLQRDAGQQDFSRVLTLTPEEAANDLGTLEYLGIQATDMVTMGDAIKAMIVFSDNAMASLIQTEVGTDSTDAMLRAAGLTDTDLHKELPTTASDMALLMETIAGRASVSAQSRHEMLSLLAQEDFVEGVITGLRPETPVVHKTGSFEGAAHDVAIVWGPAGPYTIAILSDRSFDWAPLQEISAAVYAYFDANR